MNEYLEQTRQREKMSLYVDFVEKFYFIIKDMEQESIDVKYAMICNVAENTNTGLAVPSKELLSAYLQFRDVAMITDDIKGWG